MGHTFSAQNKAADAPDIEGGLYDALFTGVTTKFISGGDYGDGERFVWSFDLLDDSGAVLYDKGDPINVDGLTSKSTNVLSKTVPKAVRYIKALTTPAEFDAFSEGKGLNEEDLVGRKCQVDVAIRENGWPSVANVLPERKARRTRAAAAGVTEEA